MITAYHVQKHADVVLEVLQALTRLLGDKGKPAESAIAMARAVLAALTDPAKSSDPADIHAARKLLLDELAKHDQRADAALAAKFDVSDEEKATNAAALKRPSAADLSK